MAGRPHTKRRRLMQTAAVLIDEDVTFSWGTWAWPFPRRGWASACTVSTSSGSCRCRSPLRSRTKWAAGWFSWLVCLVRCVRTSKTFWLWTVSVRWTASTWRWTGRSSAAVSSCRTLHDSLPWNRICRGSVRIRCFQLHRRGGSGELLGRLLRWQRMILKRCCFWLSICYLLLDIQIIIELKKEKDEVMRAAIVVGNAWLSNKVVPTGTDDPPVKPDISHNSIILFFILTFNILKEQLYFDN